MMLKQGLASAISALILGLSVNVHAVASDKAATPASAKVAPDAIVVDMKNPYKMIETAANKTFASFHQDHAKIKADPNYLKTIIQNDLMPYIDAKYASFKVLGQYYRDTSKAQRDAFVKAFSGYLITTYAQAFTAYTDQTVKFSPAQDFANERIVSVDVQVIEKNRPPIKLIFKVRRLKNDDWKAFDLIAEGVSLLSTKQSEIGNLIRQQGIDKVTAMLNDKAQAAIVNDKSEKKK